jgi:hypothetical protein
LVQKTKLAMSETQMMCKEEFGLETRVAIVPAADIYSQNLDLKIAKIRISQKYEQAVLIGSGVEKAEYYMKSMDFTKYDLRPIAEKDFRADYSGFSCRWEDINSPKEEIMALIIKATQISFMEEIKVYQEVLCEIRGALGDEEMYKPINTSWAFFNAANN